ncbi:sensor histidine kinase [Hymenobacter psychrophilus]|uniref:Histidine kinase n=1 Tax=Hymenobacter psychrophilus TaxID=651662 RepID=A0A1H3D5F1_9BACT|nr:histidine kinase [Hymenobacter psychrophilus]SDX61732.1 Histidine kinase [Hymenobacter psychrophilus]
MKTWLLILRDALVWGGLGLLLWLATSKVPLEFQPQAYRGIMPFMLLTMAAVYGNNLGLVPWLFDKGRYGWYALALLLWVLLLHAVGQLIWPGVYARSIMQPGANSLFTMLIALGLLLMWRTVAQRRQRLRGQLLEREQQLRLLEAQVNPHFLFNTLNSLYALSLTQSPQTPDMLLALAGLMRYQLESTKHAQVPLADELDYLRDYVRLQELRLGARCPVTLTLPENEEVDGLMVPPLLFLALVENAFTYGTRRAVGSFVKIVVGLIGGHKAMALVTLNALPPPSDQQGGTGTGLANTRQRLELLYPGRHILEAGPDPDNPSQFRAMLSLKLL